MGLIHVEIDLINVGDKALIRRGHMDPHEMRRITVHARVDSGAMYMAINENIQEVLQLPVVGKKRSELANGQIVDYDIVGPLEVRFEEHISNCSAIVLPGGSEPLLGAIPMEDMNIVIDPMRQELIPSPRPVRMGGLRPVN